MKTLVIISLISFAIVAIQAAVPASSIIAAFEHSRAEQAKTPNIPTEKTVAEHSYGLKNRLRDPLIYAAGALVTKWAKIFAKSISAETNYPNGIVEHMNKTRNN